MGKLLGTVGSWEWKLRVKSRGRGPRWHGDGYADKRTGCSIDSSLPESPTPWDPLSPGGMQRQFPDHCLSSAPQNCAPLQVMVIEFKLSWDTQHVFLTPKICPHLLTGAWNHRDRTHEVPSPSRKEDTEEYTHYDSLYENIRPRKTAFLRMLT